MSTGKRHLWADLVIRTILFPCLLELSGVALQSDRLAAETLRRPSYLYVAWSEPIAGGRPVLSESIYLASDGILQHACFTDRGDLLRLETGVASVALLAELREPVVAWLEKAPLAVRKEGGGSTPAPPPIAVDFQAPRVTVALGGPPGDGSAKSFGEADLPKALAPLVARARKLAAERFEAADPGGYIRLETALIRRNPDIKLGPADLRENPPLAKASMAPWRFVPMSPPITVGGKPLRKEFSPFVSIAEHLFLLCAHTLDSKPRGSEPPHG